MSDKQLDLSRRKLLAGLGTAGVAAAGAGLGTTAYLNDTESFDGNTIQAGELDLALHYSTTYTGPGENPQSAELVDGEPEILYELDDVKPGDAGTATICFDVVDNPAWVWIQGGVTSNQENGHTEPEADAESDEADAYSESDLDPGEGLGDLPGALDSTISNDGNALTGDFFDGNFSPWTLLQGDSSGGSFSASESFGEEGKHCLDFDWSVPTSVGNEIQGDSLTFNLAFYAEQARHNDRYADFDVAYASPQNPSAAGPSGNQSDFDTDRVLDIGLDYAFDNGDLNQVVYDVELEEPWSDPGESNANVALGFAGTQDGSGNTTELDAEGDWQLGWGVSQQNSSDATGFRYKENTGSGWSNWKSLSDLNPAITGSKNGTNITFTVDVDSPSFPYDAGDYYGIVGNASYGGHTHANVSTDPANSWSSDLNFTSTEHFLLTQIPGGT